MSKNLARDKLLLAHILNDQLDIIDTLKTYNCRLRDIENNKYMMMMCSAYLVQIAENIKLLLDSTKKEISKEINIALLIDIGIL